MGNKYQHYAAFILAERLGVDIETAKKIKAGEITVEDATKKPAKKKEIKTEGDSEVGNGY